MRPDQMPRQPDGELAGLPAVQRWHATGDYAYPAEEREDGEFVAYDDHRAELLRLADENARLLALCTDHAEWRQVNHEAWFAAKERAERAEAERDALRKQIPTVDELRALERCHKSQEVLRAQLDKANLDDPYASLMVAEDAMLLAGLIGRFHAAQR